MNTIDAKRKAKCTYLAFPQSVFKSLV